MAEAMLDVFARRKDRFRMLEEGTYAAGWRGGELKLLEVGCAAGDAPRGQVSFSACTSTASTHGPAQAIFEAEADHISKTAIAVFLNCHALPARHFGHFLKRENHKLAIVTDGRDIIMPFSNDAHHRELCATAQVDNLAALACFGDHLTHLCDKAFAV